VHTLALVLSLIGTPATAMQADTVILLGSRTVDITGDGRGEVLQLVGTGASSDSLAVTFSITSDGQLLYSQSVWPLTRMIGFDAARRRTSATEHQQRIQELGAFFFAEENFLSPPAFIERLSGSAPRHIDSIPAVIARHGGPDIDHQAAAAIWANVLESKATIFEFSVGGDGLSAIVWSEAVGRFVQLWECC
jgi:hypothetical protein